WRAAGGGLGGETTTGALHDAGCAGSKVSAEIVRAGYLAVVALGSNLGDSTNTIRAAMERLQALAKGPMLHSSLWRTAPVDCPPGSPDFINAAVAFEPLPGETPESLLAKLQSLEGEFGRKPKHTLN